MFFSAFVPQDSHEPGARPDFDALAVGEAAGFLNRLVIVPALDLIQADDAAVFAYYVGPVQFHLPQPSKPVERSFRRLQFRRAEPALQGCRCVCLVGFR